MDMELLNGRLKITFSYDFMTEEDTINYKHIYWVVGKNKDKLFMLLDSNENVIEENISLQDLCEWVEDEYIENVCLNKDCIKLSYMSDCFSSIGNEDIEVWKRNIIEEEQEIISLDRQRPLQIEYTELSKQSIISFVKLFVKSLSTSLFSFKILIIFIIKYIVLKIL